MSDVCELAAAVYAERRSVPVWPTYAKFATYARAATYAAALLPDFDASFDQVILEELNTGTKHVITSAGGSVNLQPAEAGTSADRVAHL